MSNNQTVLSKKQWKKKSQPLFPQETEPNPTNQPKQIRRVN